MNIKNRDILAGSCTQQKYHSPEYQIRSFAFVRCTMRLIQPTPSPINRQENQDNCHNNNNDRVTGYKLVISFLIQRKYTSAHGQWVRELSKETGSCMRQRSRENHGPLRRFQPITGRYFPGCQTAYFPRMEPSTRQKIYFLFLKNSLIEVVMLPGYLFPEFSYGFLKYLHELSRFFQYINTTFEITRMYCR